MTYRIHWIVRDSRKGYPFEVRVTRDGELVGCEGARCEDEWQDAHEAAVRQARSRMKRCRRDRMGGLK